MGIFRSEDMFLYKFVCSKDSSYTTMTILGDKECAHLIDMNKDQ